ncbi:hypothetical protein L6164_035243 [Bauhinia variegata]|uniref:Uncharacterized protein n=1 Tax=Bauhinia variegata TaxID=167791 RepID=A0ACB9KX55_BAUVA|nr:hypothetical protein L6164_035243 [Bauhinia variegata]
MEFRSFYFLSTILFLYLSQFICHCQQVYLNNTVDNCTANPLVPKGYLCNGPQKSCTSFLIFKSNPPYNTTLRIAYLLGSEASTIASINKISNSDTIPSNKSIIVPINCSCSGNIYQHNTPYSVVKNDTYYHLVIGNFQGLTTCQALMGQNYYPPENIAVGAMLTVPLICACPSAKQGENGVTSLLVYTVNHGDTLQSIGGAFGVDEQSIREANQLPPNGTISTLSPLLLPLKGKNCKEDPNSFFCVSCSQGQGSLAVADESLKGLYCNPSTSQKVPVKLVTSLGVGIGVGFLCLFLSGYKLYQCLKEKRRKILKEKLFRQNGRKPISFLEDEGQNLIAEFISLMKENQPFEIIDAGLVKEARKDDILAIANLARRCLRLNGKKRPTMKEIAVELETLRKAQSSLQINQDPYRISMHTTRGTVRESSEESILLSLQMDSSSLI